MQNDWIFQIYKRVKNTGITPVYAKIISVCILLVWYGPSASNLTALALLYTLQTVYLQLSRTLDKSWLTFPLLYTTITLLTEIGINYSLLPLFNENLWLKWIADKKIVTAYSVFFGGFVCIGKFGSILNRVLEGMNDAVGVHLISL
jgi:hypothetical protein